MKTTRFVFDGLNKPTDWNVGCFYGWHVEGRKTPYGEAHKNCYGGNERIRFTRPSRNCFYMKTLRRLIKSDADAFELGTKVRVATVIGNETVRKNTGMLGAMRKAGLISYSRKANKWSITEVGKHFYKEATKYIENN